MDLLLRRTSRLARAMAIRGGCRPEDLDDVLQEAAVQMLTWLPTLREPEAFVSWFSRLVLMAARSHQRREQRRRKLAPLDAREIEGDLWMTGANPEVIAEAREVARMIGVLPEKVREAVRLRHLEGMRLEEVAARTGASLATVKRYLAAAQTEVRRVVARDLRRAGMTAPVKKRRRGITTAVLALALGLWRRGGALARVMVPAAVVAGVAALLLGGATRSPQSRASSIRPPAWQPLPLPATATATAGVETPIGIEAWTATAAPADALVESIGLNVRLREDPQGLPLVRERLVELGARHVIDVQGSRLDWLASLESLGIRTNLFIETDADAHAAVAGLSFVEAITIKQHRPGVALAAWAQVQRRWMEQTHHRLRADPSTRHVAIVGPTMADEAKREALGDVSAFVDFGASGGPAKRLPPGGAFLDGTLAVYRSIYGVKPVVIPQALFATGSCADCLSEPVQARYVVRTVFESQRRGIVRTYVPHLFDREPDPRRFEDGMGLLRRDGERKPSFEALARMIRLFSDPGPAPVARIVPLELADAPMHLEKALYLRRDGTLLLALWLAVASAPDEASSLVRIRLPDALRAGPLHRAVNTGSLTASGPDAEGFVTVPVSDDVAVLELR